MNMMRMKKFVPSRRAADCRYTFLLMRFLAGRGVLVGGLRGVAGKLD
jgi:hypothetical protein